MSVIISHCGLVCSECSAYKATVTNDDSLREQTAKEWSIMFGGHIKPASVNCLGCQQNEVLFDHCRTCEIRTCATAKGFDSCAPCPDFGCKKVLGIWQHDEEARKRLENLRP